MFLYCLALLLGLLPGLLKHRFSLFFIVFFFIDGLLLSVLDVVKDPARSVIISSHQLQDVERIADRLLVLDAGAVINEGPTNELVGEDRTLEEALLAWGAAG